jgi:hypothetical protein
MKEMPHDAHLVALSLAARDLTLEPDLDALLVFAM